MNQLFRELNSILLQYAEENREFEFAKHFEGQTKTLSPPRSCESDGQKILTNTIIHFQTDMDFSPTDPKNCFLYNQPLYNPSQYLIDCEKKNMNSETKFDLFANILFSDGIQNTALLNFIMNVGAKIIIIALEPSCIDDLKKQLINIDLTKKNSAIQRFKHFESISQIITKLSAFKNLTATTESIEIQCQSLQHFLKSPKNSWLFGQKHFENLTEIDNQENFCIEFKFVIISCLKN